MRVTGLALLASFLYVQNAAGEVQPTTASQTPVNADSKSCQDLKTQLQSAKALTIVSAPTGWGDTYYAQLPRCQFWQRPMFAYVVANNGWCGVGYNCAGKTSGN